MGNKGWDGPQDESYWGHIQEQQGFLKDTPDTILEALESLDLLEGGVAAKCGASFYNTAWKHKDSNESFVCTGRFISGVIAALRNKAVARLREPDNDWVPEIYAKWLYTTYKGGVYEPLKTAMNERGWVVDPT